MTRRTFIKLMAIGFMAGFCHELNSGGDDDEEGTL